MNQQFECWRWCLAWFGVLGLASLLSAQSEHAHAHGEAPDGGSPAAMPMEFGGIPATRHASGTAWQPDASPMHAHHWMAGNWSLMTHYNVFVAYDDQSGPRGDSQLNSINWLMLMASQRRERNEFTLRAMFSLEPWSTTKRGYPLLFQSGEAYQGAPLVDRQHPHDLFMELAATYRRETGPGTVWTLYVAPSGEPALGPAAFPHRMSAMDNPAAPISHHWLDSTHISFGVLTLGVARRTWQLEGSWFNGREPDEHRWNVNRPRLNSYAGRLSWNPTPINSPWGRGDVVVRPGGLGFDPWTASCWLLGFPASPSRGHGAPVPTVTLP